MYDHSLSWVMLSGIRHGRMMYRSMLVSNDPRFTLPFDKQLRAGFTIPLRKITQDDHSLSRVMLSGALLARGWSS